MSATTLTGVRLGPYAPWPYLLQRQAAKRLGVSVEFLSGLTNQKMSKTPLRSVLAPTIKGGWVRLYCRADVDRLAENR